MSSYGIWLAAPKRTYEGGPPVRVEASPTVFHAHPDGARTLVRFSVSGVDAPAGRLRVFDTNNRLLATAGVLRSGDGLYGELWLPLERALSVVSALEAPGLRGPYRTSHRLAPQPRWTVHVLHVADPEAIASTMEGLRPLHQGVQSAMYRESALTVNPLPRTTQLMLYDHVPFLRLAEPAVDVELRFAIPTSRAAFGSATSSLPKTTALALAGSGVEVLLIERPDGEPIQWWQVPGIPRFPVVTVHPGSTPNALGFDLTQDEMARRIERWLTATPLFVSPSHAPCPAIVVNTVAAAALAGVHAAVSAWNSRFAYPRLVVGDTAALLDIEPAALVSPVTLPPAVARPDEPETRDVSAINEMRQSQAAARTGDMVRVLAERLGHGAVDLEAVAAEVDTSVPGTVVFNPSPYPRSEFVRMSDGAERIATDVPGLGYAYFPDAWDAATPATWEPSGEGYTIDGERFRVTVDPSSGAIVSLLDRGASREWVRPDSGGLNVVQGAQLERHSRLRLPNLATRIVAQRWLPLRGAVTSTLTVYDSLPGVDIENDGGPAGPGMTPYEFHLALDRPQVSWEIPAGWDRAAAPVARLEHLRWIRIADRDSAILFRGTDAPIASVETGGSLTSYAPHGRSRYRLDAASPYALEDTPWIFGWGAEPMAIARARAERKGRLPRFGSLLSIERVGVTVLGLLPARQEDGAIVYVQETLGVDREVSIEPGVLRFSRAVIVDYVERDREELAVRADGSVLVPVPANGVSAVRLCGLELNAQ